MDQSIATASTGNRVQSNLQHETANLFSNQQQESIVNQGLQGNMVTTSCLNTVSGQHEAIDH